jgi:hypothetical protein
MEAVKTLKEGNGAWQDIAEETVRRILLDDLPVTMRLYKSGAGLIEKVVVRRL